MKIYKSAFNTTLLSASVLLAMVIPQANAANSDGMNKSEMAAMSGMNDDSMNDSDNNGDMKMSGMDMSDMDMSGMQGGYAPSDARSSDYSNGVGYGQYGKPTMEGSLPTWGVSVSKLGYLFDNDAINYETEAWVGTDSQRLMLRSEGEIQTKDDKNIDSLTSLSYWQPLGIYWNGQAGVAYDTKNDKAAIMTGIEGTTPYFIDTEARAYLYTDGQVRLDLEAEYEWRLNQHWVVIPEAELTVFGKDDTDNNITRGFNGLETEVRLTYQTLGRQLAPYVGYRYETALGSARGQQRKLGEEVDSSSVTAGVKFWF
ncbi:copper resistance protein B [Psychrobacter frigidicola]|uniref:Copper resistance protein B n=1 Tax=Psychrobacter frigidicola TaxID=45611 RepID=A0A5C7A587_9GAMM|nr:copper resistance protein B [Psychrobacter frigidicola]TXD97845.1 copper resistance protein B [Psychrobacter frigidicola]